MKGKYGYYDPEGVLREATYGAEAGRGFEPEIEGIELPPPTIVQEIENEIPQTIVPEMQDSQRFNNFQPQSGTLKKLPTTLPKIGTAPEIIKVKIVNCRRAVLGIKLVLGRVDESFNRVV